MSLTHGEEKILEAVIDGSSVPFDPVTRREKIFAKAAGEDIELAPPITKEEQILSALAAKGSGGGGSSDFSTAEVTITATENKDVIDSIYVLGFDTDYNVWTIYHIAPDEMSQAYQIVVPQSGLFIYGLNGNLGNTSGNIHYDAEKEGYFITGNCAIELYSATHS